MFSIAQWTMMIKKLYNIESAIKPYLWVLVIMTTIRGLLRFIEMISRKSILEDVIRNGGAPNYKR